MLQVKSTKQQMAYAQLSAAVSLLPPEGVNLTNALSKHLNGAVAKNAIAFVEAMEEETEEAAGGK